MSSSSTSTEDDDDVPRLQVGTPVLFVEDPVEILARMSSSRSLGSITHDNIEEQQQVQQQLQQSFPGLRRVGTYPLPGSRSGPPRKPIRSSSADMDVDEDVYSNDNSDDNDSSSQSSSPDNVVSGHAIFEEDEEDEIDLEKYRQLLLGNNDYCGPTISNSQDSEEQAHTGTSGTSGSPSLVPLRDRPREMSWGSAPFLREHSGSGSHAMPNTPGTRQSLPTFRPIRHVRRPRRTTRSLVQDMLSPASETSSRSIRMPPRLPSRMDSDLSNVSLARDGNDAINNDAPTATNPTQNWQKTGKSTIPAVLVLCNKALVSSTPSFVSVCSSSQKSTNTTTSAAVHRGEAPRRPRRTLSPIFGESLRSLLQLHEKQDQEDGDIPKEFPLRNSTNTTNTAATTVMTDMSKSTTLRSIHSSRKRNTPIRAKTFSFCVKEKPAMTMMCQDNTIVPVDLFRQLQQHTDNKCISVQSSPNKTMKDLESLWTATTWPKPRRNRVAPGRSSTFTSHQTSSGFWTTRNRC